MRVEYTAPEEVRAVIANLGRTEDIRFSPDGKRLALAGFLKNRIALFDIGISVGSPEKTITLHSVSVLTSASLQGPHGLDFIDNETLVVSNRNGGVSLFRLPPKSGGMLVQELQLSPLATIESDLLNAPGSVASHMIDSNRAEILICNNSGHSISRHQFARDTTPALQGHEVLLRKWLDIPDGISRSQTGAWLAVSNHMLHSVLLYRNTADLHPDSEPQGLLCGAHYPHGLRICAEDRHILVADAGAPFVYIYARQRDDWSGLHYPLHRLRVMDDTQFQCGRHNPQEGGPKGLDLHNASGILVTTCARQSLAFFDVEAILARPPSPTRPDNPCLSADTADVRQELERQWLHAHAAVRSVQADIAEATVQAMLNSRSWRITAPLRGALTVRNTFK